MKIFKIYSTSGFISSLLISILVSQIAYAQKEVCQAGDGKGLTIVEDCSNNLTSECTSKACYKITNQTTCDQSAVMTDRDKNDHLWRIHGAVSCIWVTKDLESPPACYTQKNVACLIKKQ